MPDFEIDVAGKGEPGKVSPAEPKRRGKTVMKIAIVVIVVLAVVGSAVAAAGFIYWRSLVDSPQYALARIVQAARDDNDPEIGQLVDFDRVVRDFVPQVTDKAVDLYGRGLPPEVIRQAEVVAAPLIPVIKARARKEIPTLLKEATRKYSNVPFWGLVIGADRYLDFKVEGDTASVESTIGERRMTLLMERTEGGWKVVAVRDEVLAKKIAERIGQELIFLAKEAGKDKVDRLGKSLGIEDIEELLKQAGDIFK